MKKAFARGSKPLDSAPMAGAAMAAPDAPGAAAFGAFAAAPASPAPRPGGFAASPANDSAVAAISAAAEPALAPLLAPLVGPPRFVSLHATLPQLLVTSPRAPEVLAWIPFFLSLNFFLYVFVSGCSRCLYVCACVEFALGV